jgi:nucleoside-diphosphate-sugar epimerase
MTSLTTGADGFVGSDFCDRLRNETVPLCGYSRRLKSALYADQNVEGSIKLKRQAAAHEVSCYVFLRLIKVNSKLTVAGHPFAAFDKKRPLPVCGIQNQQSLIYLQNLVDVILLFFAHSKSAGKLFLVCNSSDVSMAALIPRVAMALGRRPLLLAAPVSLLKLVGTLLGKKVAVDQTLGPLSADMNPIQEDLSWSQPYTMHAGLTATAEWYPKAKVSL